MTRKWVYSTALVSFVLCTALTITSIGIPRWISWDTAAPPNGKPVHVSYGLHERCSSLDNSCRHFPRQDECEGDERAFCSMWRSVGFLMSFAVVIEGMTLIAFLVLISAGKQKREGGWGIVSGLIALAALVQVAGVSIMAHLNDNDPRFSIPGFHLDASFHMCTWSWAIMAVTAVGVGVSKYLLEPEGGYELIPDES